MVDESGEVGCCIDGPGGTGKTELCNFLVPCYRLNRYGSGDSHRAIASERGVSPQELERMALTDRTIDEKIDIGAVAHACHNVNFLLDGRVTAYLCRRFVSTHRRFVTIHLSATDEVRYARILKRERKKKPESNLTLADIEALEKDREAAMATRMHNLYLAPLSVLQDSKNRRLYDLAIDTTELEPHDVAALVDRLMAQRLGLVNQALVQV